MGILEECGQSFYIHVLGMGKYFLWLIVNTQTAAWEVFHVSVAEDALKEAAAHGDACWSRLELCLAQSLFSIRSCEPVGSPD